MKILLMLLLAGAAQAANISGSKNLTIQLGGGGSDPTKLPLAGGVMVGTLTVNASSYMNGPSEFSTVTFKNHVYLKDQAVWTAGVASSTIGFNGSSTSFGVKDSTLMLLSAGEDGLATDAEAAITLSPEASAGATNRVHVVGTNGAIAISLSDHSPSSLTDADQGVLMYRSVASAGGEKLGLYSGSGAMTLEATPTDITLRRNAGPGLIVTSTAVVILGDLDFGMTRVNNACSATDACNANCGTDSQVMGGACECTDVAPKVALAASRIATGPFPPKTWHCGTVTTCLGTLNATVLCGKVTWHP